VQWPSAKAKLKLDIHPAESSAPPDDALCFLSVPVNKTGTSFTKPVHWMVGRRIAEWERVRPVQAPALDPKTNELVDFLFSFRGKRIGPAYVNLRLIPLLCRKANVPELDTRGNITAHRASNDGERSVQRTGRPNHRRNRRMARPLGSSLNATLRQNPTNQAGQVDRESKQKLPAYPSYDRSCPSS
jgi:hypothetical protein